LLHCIQTEISNDTLVIRSSSSYHTEQPVTIKIRTPHLQGVNLMGSSAINVHDLNEPLFHAAISGAGTVVASGSSPELDVTVGGSGTMQLERLHADTAHADISGSGNITLYASSSLDAKIHGSGTIKYKGTPTVTKHIDGSGAVVEINGAP
ncbi:MAG: GIN domain-containing protein, partial [Terriglobales bacterium]